MSRALRTLAYALVALAYRAYYRTLRVEGLLADGRFIAPREYPFGPELFALCERDVLGLAGLCRYTSFTILVALGRDGDWATGLLERLGFAVVRGSSLRGGSRALTALVHRLRDNPEPCAIVVDGPLGPTGEAKAGVVAASGYTSRPLRALAIAARREIVLGHAWSGIYLPAPFTRVVVACDDPLPELTSRSRSDIEEQRQRLSERLRCAREQACVAVSAHDRTSFAPWAADRDLGIAPNRQVASDLT